MGKGEKKCGVWKDVGRGLGGVKSVGVSDEKCMG